MPAVYLSASSLLSQVKSRGQLSIVPMLVRTGIRGIEIRHELLSRHDVALTGACNLQTESELHVVYSAPVSLFENSGKYNANIEQIIEQAGRLGCNLVKFPLGRYVGVTSELDALRKALANFNKHYPGLILTVENNQTTQGGRIKALQEFLFACEDRNVPVWMTFDIGNWQYVDEDPEKAADNFNRFVRYIHVKHVEKREGAFVTLPIPNCSDSAYRKLLSRLPENVPRCIEFPIAEEDCESRLAEYVKFLGS